MADKKRQSSPHFFMREGDGSVRLRIRLTGDEASQIEEAAGTTPLLTWIHQTLAAAARRQVRSARGQRPPVGPPSDTEET